MISFVEIIERKNYEWRGRKKWKFSQQTSHASHFSSTPTSENDVRVLCHTKKWTIIEPKTFCKGDRGREIELRRPLKTYDSDDMAKT